MHEAYNVCFHPSIRTVRVSSSAFKRPRARTSLLHAHQTFGALGKPGSSRLIFNQEMRGFKSHTPCQLWANAERDYICEMSRHARSLSPFVWVVAQMAEHRTVTAASEGSTPFDPPKPNGALGKSGLSHLSLNQAIVGSNPTRAAKISHGTVAER